MGSDVFCFAGLNNGTVQFLKNKTGGTCDYLCFMYQLKEIYTLLNENYVEDDDNMFRFDYSPDFLHW